MEEKDREKDEEKVNKIKNIRHTIVFNYCSCCNNCNGIFIYGCTYKRIYSI